MRSNDLVAALIPFALAALLVSLALLGSRLGPSGRRSLERFMLLPLLVMGVAGLTIDAWVERRWLFVPWLLVGALAIYRLGRGVAARRENSPSGG